MAGRAALVTMLLSVCTRDARAENSTGVPVGTADSCAGRCGAVLPDRRLPCCSCARALCLSLAPAGLTLRSHISHFLERRLVGRRSMQL